MLSRRAMRSLIRSATWAVTVVCLGAWIFSMGARVQAKVCTVGQRCWTVESSAGAFYLSNLDNGSVWNDPTKPARRVIIKPINLIAKTNIRWWPRYRGYGVGFTLVVPYWASAAAIAALYILVPWVRLRAKCCLECGYSLVGLPAAAGGGVICPECGTPARPRASRAVETSPTLTTAAIGGDEPPAPEPVQIEVEVKPAEPAPR